MFDKYLERFDASLNDDIDDLTLSCSDGDGVDVTGGVDMTLSCDVNNRDDTDMTLSCDDDDDVSCAQSDECGIATVDLASSSIEDRYSKEEDDNLELFSTSNVLDGFENAERSGDVVIDFDTLIEDQIDVREDDVYLKQFQYNFENGVCVKTDHNVSNIMVDLTNSESFNRVGISIEKDKDQSCVCCNVPEIVDYSPAEEEEDNNDDKIDVESEEDEDEIEFFFKSKENDDDRHSLESEVAYQSETLSHAFQSKLNDVTISSNTNGRISKPLDFINSSASQRKLGLNLEQGSLINLTTSSNTDLLVSATDSINTSASQNKMKLTIEQPTITDSMIISPNTATSKHLVAQTIDDCINQTLFIDVDAGKTNAVNVDDNNNEGFSLFVHDKDISELQTVESQNHSPNTVTYADFQTTQEFPCTPKAASIRNETNNYDDITEGPNNNVCDSGQMKTGSISTNNNISNNYSVSFLDF